MRNHDTDLVSKDSVTASIKKLFSEHDGNTISAEQAISPELEGLRIYDEPLIGFGSASDPLFEEFKKTEAIGPWHMSPCEWLPQAKTVVSMFFPFTEEVRSSNRPQTDWPSSAWLHGRIEGQAFLNDYMKSLKEYFESKGIETCVPSLDPRWEHTAAGRGKLKGYKEITDKTFSSRWSERHAAFVCGLGTFGLSKGLITEKGMAGRFASILLPAGIEPDTRSYSEVYERCIQCGECVRRCPAGAITLEHGKDHSICSAMLQEAGRRFSPRYGCGLCQTNVPCENRDPSKAIGK